MITEFKLPDIGEGIAEAEIVEWTVKEGDFVNAYQNIVKIETDKAVADLPSPVTGTMLNINFQKGEKVKSSANKKFDKGANDVVNNTRDSVGKESVVSGKILASPAVRKVAVERGIDLNNLKGSGADGQIVMSDLDKNGFSKVTEIVETSPALNIQKKYDQFGYIDRIPFKGVRKLIAQNMIRSLSQSAQVTSMEDIDVGRLWAMRLREKEHFALEGVKLTFMPFVIKALIKALTKHPKLNSSLEGESIVMKKYYNIGVAVQTDAGLLVPVVKIAERKSISDIAKEIE